jgi:hypothetical protein
MSTATTDVLGSSPLAFTDAKGAQRSVPLSAFEFSGSKIQLKAAWQTDFSAAEAVTLVALATARASTGELVPPPKPPKSPAVAFTAKHAGPESNNITVTAAADQGMSPLATTMAISATETDTWTGLATGAAAAKALGVDNPTGAPGDPLKGTGLVVVKQGSVGASTKPAVASSGVMAKATGVDIKDTDSKVVMTILPRADYAGTGGLSYEVTATSTTFTLTATYDSSKESGNQSKVTVLTLDQLPAQVAYLVGAAAPPSGAAVPASGSVQLTGGGTGLAASGLLYTS